MLLKKYRENNSHRLPNWVRITLVVLVLFFSYPFQVSSASAKQSIFLQEILTSNYRNTANCSAFSCFKTNANKKQIGLVVIVDFNKHLAFFQKGILVQYKLIAFNFICSKAIQKTILLQRPLFYPNEAESKSAFI